MNYEKYGQDAPPRIRLDKAKADVPVVVFYGCLDSLTEKSDLAWLFDQLGDSVVYKEELEAGHITFLIG